MFEGIRIPQFLYLKSFRGITAVGSITIPFLSFLTNEVAATEVAATEVRSLFNLFKKLDYLALLQIV